MHTAGTLPHPLLLLTAEPARSASARDRASEAAWLALGGRICRRAREIGASRRPGHPMPTVTFTRFTPAVSARSVVAQGDAVEVGVTYGFMVFGDGSVALNSPRGLIPARHKAPLRTTILAAHRAATAEAAR